MATPEQRDEKLGSALDLAAAFKPQDGVQGAMATMCASLFFGANAMIQRSANPQLPPQLSVAFAKTAARLSDAFTSMSEAIQRRQGGGATHQRVVVEHVTVQAGGQAVVGAVSSGKGGGGDGV
jgi:hypothetical protein